MKKYTFEELIGECAYSHDCSSFIEVVTKSECIKLLKQVREATLQEAANEADTCEEAVMRGHRIIVDKNTILDLDKDSIEVDE